MSAERWCERCEWWAGLSLLLPDGRCAVHLVPTETAEEIRRDRERGWPRPEESLRAALGERLACGGLDVPRGFDG